MQVSAAAPAALVARIGPPAVLVRAARIASAVVMFRAVAQVTGTPSEVVPEDSMDPVRAATAVVDRPAWDLAVEDSAAPIAAAEGFAAVALAAAAAVVFVAVAGAVAAVVVAAVAEAVAEGECSNRSSPITGYGYEINTSED